MKHFLLATTALVLAGQAQAAERPYSWTGCYIGGHIGQGRTNTRISEPDDTAVNGVQYFAPTGTAIGVRDTGTVGGIQGGCDYQFAQNWLAGVGGDFSWANIDGQTVDPFFAGKNGGPVFLNSKTDRLATVTGRVGFVWDRVLVFGKGGAAWARSTHSIEGLTFWGNPVSGDCLSGGVSVPCNPAGTDKRSGWTLGAGVEWAFAARWSVGVAYDHYDFGTRTISLTDPNGAPGLAGMPVTGPVDVKQTIDTVRLSFNYRLLPWGVR
jgi:outer membrane immunogenic protein